MYGVRYVSMSYVRHWHDTNILFTYQVSCLLFVYVSWLIVVIDISFEDLGNTSCITEILFQGSHYWRKRTRFVSTLHWSDFSWRDWEGMMSTIFFFLKINISSIFMKNRSWNVDLEIPYIVSKFEHTNMLMKELFRSKVLTWAFCLQVFLRKTWLFYFKRMTFHFLFDVFNI